MDEPKLEDIGDYNTLAGEKRKTVIAVILSGLIMGIIYTLVSIKYDKSEDTLQVNETFKQVPMR